VNEKENGELNGEVNEKEITALQADLDAANSQVDELNAQLAQRDARIAEIQSQLTEQLTIVEDKERELVTLRESSLQAEGNIATLSESLQEAITKYRDTVVAANPDVPGEMITGESIADIDGSLDMAKALVSKVKATLDEQAKATLVPAGSPERSGPDISSLSPREKIEYAIRKEAD